MVVSSATAGAGMFWMPSLYGLVTHPLRSYWFFEAVRPWWQITGALFVIVTVPLSIVALLRREMIGIFGLVLVLSVLSGVWSWFIAVP
jgi:hypothetical protein